MDIIRKIAEIVLGIIGLIFSVVFIVAVWFGASIIIVTTFAMIFCFLTSIMLPISAIVTITILLMTLAVYIIAQFMD